MYMTLVAYGLKTSRRHSTLQQERDIAPLACETLENLNSFLQLLLLLLLNLEHCHRVTNRTCYFRDTSLAFLRPSEFIIR